MLILLEEIVDEFELFVLFFVMVRLTPTSTTTDTLFPYTTLFRSDVPDRIDAVIVGAGEQVELLAAPDRGGGEVFVHAGLEFDVIGFEEFAGFPELLVEQAERRATVTGDEAGGVQAGGEIALSLQHRQAHQARKSTRLNSSH